MTHFRIENQTSGIILGVYDGDTEKEAIQRMFDDAGCEALPSNHIVAKELEEYSIEAWLLNHRTTQEVLSSLNLSPNSTRGDIGEAADVVKEEADEAGVFLIGDVERFLESILEE